MLALLPSPAVDLLDWGCGPALAAPAWVDAGVRVSLYDKAVATQNSLAAEFAADPRVRVLADADYAELPDESFDVLLVNSVVQYRPPADSARCCRSCGGCSAPAGGCWWPT